MSAPLSLYAYPWDLVDDPDAMQRVRAMDVDRVLVAAAYHSVRAATPRHPRHKIVDARWAAVYPPFRRQAFAKLPIVPREPGDWVTSDAFGSAKRTLAEAGMDAGGWLALTHVDFETDSARFRVVNAFGDTYRHALCPSHDAVVDYSATVVRETVDGGELSSIAIEAWSQLGLVHASEHDKTSASGWSDADIQLLSVCFCSGCAQLYTAMGCDGHALREEVSHAVGTPRAGSVRDACAEIVLGARAVSRRRMLSAVIPAARDAGATKVELHVDDDEWGTGPAGPLTEADGASAVIAPAWRMDAESIDHVHRLARIRPDVGAYVSILGDETSEELAAHWSALASAGASSLHLYHFGLVSENRIAAAAGARRLFRNADSAF